MDEIVFFGILGLAAVAWFVLGGIGFFMSLGHGRRVQELEKQVRNLTAQLGSGAQPAREEQAEIGQSTSEPDQPKQPWAKPDETPQSDSKPKQSAAAATAVPQRTELPRKPSAPPKDTGPGSAERVFANFQANWVIWIGALSLALGGVFFVQYGLEKGYLGPVGRVSASLVFGVALLLVAFRVKRARGDTPAGLFTADTALAAGGIASLFAGTVSAHVLYDLTNGPVAFVSMAVVAWLALGGGILFGPVMAVIGILGAFVTPALVSSEAPSPFMYLYFMIVLAASLGVERYQKWIWFSTLAVAGAFVWGGLLYSVMPYDALFGLYFGGVLSLVLTIPAFGVLPQSDDPQLFGLSSLKNLSRQYPTVLAVVSSFAAALLLVLIGMDTNSSYETAAVTLLVFMGVSVLLLYKAENLDQLAVVFGIALLALMSGHVHMRFGPVSAISGQFAFTAVVTAAAIGFCLLGAIWRAERSSRATYWVWIAAVAPVLGLGLLWLNWHHIAEVPNAYWLVAGLALLMIQIANAGFFHKVRDRFPIGSDVYTGSAILIALEMSYADLTGSQLTIAIAGLALIAAWAEGRFAFGVTGRLVTALVALATARLVLFPGLPWALEADLALVLQAFLGAIGTFTIGVLVTQKAGKMVNNAMFETAASALIGTVLCVLGARYLGTTHGQNLQSISLYGLVWGLLALGQFVRSRQGDHERVKSIRMLLGRIYTIGFGVALAFCLTVVNPLTSGSIKGPPLADTLAFAFLLPAGLAYLLLRTPEIAGFVPKWARYAVPAALGFLYLGLEIRRMWQGDVLHGSGVKDGELYSYTVLMLGLTLGVIFLSLIMKSPILRKIGLACVALTAAKVFLWDMSGLAGLARATSFVALGLILAGIAWVYQRFNLEPEVPEQPEDCLSNGS